MRSIFSQLTARIPRVAGIFAMSLALLARAGEPATVDRADLTQLTLEQLMEIQIPTVHAASRFDQKTTEAPSSVTVITAEEIKRFGHRTLADVLQSVQGLYVSYDRNYAFLGMRGIN